MALVALDAHCRLEGAFDDGRCRAHSTPNAKVTTFVVGIVVALRVIVVIARIVIIADVDCWDVAARG